MGTQRNFIFHVKERQLVFWILLSCITAEALLLFLDLTITYGAWISSRPIQHLFHLGREDSIGTWFSVTQTLFVALVAGAVFVLERKKHRKKRAPWGWAVLSAFFMYMTIDDGSKMHERVGSTIRRGIASDVFEAFPSYSWQIVLGPFFIAMGIFIAVFLWTQLTKRLRWWVLAGLSCLATAMFLDFIEGLDGNPYQGLASSLHVSSFAIEHWSKAIEETMEMFGMTCFLVTFLQKLMASFHSVRFEISSSK